MKEFYCVTNTTWDGTVIDSFWKSKAKAEKRCKKLVKKQVEESEEAAYPYLEEDDKYYVSTCKFED